MNNQIPKLHFSEFSDQWQTKTHRKKLLKNIEQQKKYFLQNMFV